MQESNISHDYLAALQDIANEISKLRQALKPEKKQMTKEEIIEEGRRTERNIFGD